jgi:CubicO group peptidase (beta-lactamase class C family)
MHASRTSLDSLLQSLLELHSVSGASLAVVRNGSIEVATAGTRDIATGEAVDTQTVFDAASLTKPLVAYTALQLADAGVLDLDERLAGFVQPVVHNDTRASLITARHILTHTCGLQNLRGKGESLRMYFEPGSWFSYSSLGFMYLQMAIEARTGESLETTVERLVFEPLGMRSSSLQWQDRFTDREAMPHEDGERVDAHRAPAPNASYSLKTTAGDYGAFVAAVLRGDRLKEETWRQWLTAAVMVPQGAIVHLDAGPTATEPDIGWGLGWGVEPSVGTFFQWGKMTGVRAFVMGSPAEHSGVVLFTNSNTGLRLMQDVTEGVLPGKHSAFKWLAGGVSE